MKRLGGMLFVAVALSLTVWQTVAGASGKTNVSWTMHGAYTCFDGCATTAGSGTANSDYSLLGAMTWTNTGEGTGLAGCQRNLQGFTVFETWTFTTQNGDQLDLATTSDILCLVSGQVATETATFDIVGGTGALQGASGSGTFSITDLTNPSNENGKFNATINLA